MRFRISKEALRVIRTDLKRTTAYLNLIEAAKKADDPESQAAALNREALSLAAVVTYCRPFTACVRKDGKKKPWIPKNLVNDLSSNSQFLHLRITMDRNRFWAHADENDPRDKSKEILPLKKSVIPEFQHLIQEIMDRLEVQP